MVPKRYERETGNLHCVLGGTDHSSQLDRNVTKGNKEFALQSRWDRSLISVGPKRYEGKQKDYNPISVRPRSLSVRPKRLGFVAVAMTSELGGAGLERIDGAEFDFWFGSYVDVRK